jgi:hypothetical protein
MHRVRRDDPAVGGRDVDLRRGIPGLPADAEEFVFPITISVKCDYLNTSFIPISA